MKEHDYRVRAGNTQSIPFSLEEEHPPPPFYSLNALWPDQLDLNKNNEQRKTKDSKLKTIFGYAGKAKDTKQILWERGLWKPQMRSKLSLYHL